MTAEHIEDHRKRVVRELGHKRAQLLGQPDRSTIDGGRILAFDLEGTFFDGVAASTTDGFFDDEDLPPWDTWITYGFHSTLKSNCLFSWVPKQFEAVVEHAIQAHLTDAYVWVDLDSVQQADPG